MNEKVKRTVPLTDDQYDKLWEDRKARDAVADIVGGAILSAAKKLAEQDKQFWVCVSRLTKTKPNEINSIDWLNRCVNVLEKGE